MVHIFYILFLLPIALYAQIPVDHTGGDKIVDHGFEYRFRTIEDSITEKNSSHYISAIPDAIHLITADSVEAYFDIYSGIIRFYNPTKQVVGITLTPSSLLMIVDKEQLIKEMSGIHEYFSVGDTLKYFQCLHVTESRDSIEKFSFNAHVMFIIKNIYYSGEVGQTDSPYHWRVEFPDNRDNDTETNYYILINKETKEIDETNFSYFDGLKIQAMATLKLGSPFTLPQYWDYKYD